MPLTTEPLVELVDALRVLPTADPPGPGWQATLNPSELNLPGVWVALDSVRRRTMAGDYVLNAAVYLISNDTDDERALELLLPMLDELLAIIPAAGDTESTRVVLPRDSTTAYPALRVPVTLTT